MSYSMTSLFNTAANASSTLLNIYYGNTPSTMAGSGQSPVTALTSAQATETTQVAQTEKTPSVVTAMAAFTKAVANATSLQQALANPAIVNVLLTANGMQDQIGNTALISKVLTSNLSDPNALANVLTDPRWKTLAQTYNFATNGLAALQKPATQAAIKLGYAQATWQAAQNTTTPGLSEALTFIQQAASCKTVDQVLSNMTVRNVVTTALGVPQQIAFQSLNAQQVAISSHLDVTQLQNPKFVQTLAEQYLIAQQAQSASPTSFSTDLTSLAVQASAQPG
jgi:hypothetical protein